MTVRLGEHDLRQDPDCDVVVADKICAPRLVDVAVEEVVSHPGHAAGDGDDDDVALVRLARPVATSEAVVPVCLPAHVPDLPEQLGELSKRSRLNYQVVGWARTAGAGHIGEHHLRTGSHTKGKVTSVMVRTPYSEMDT